MLRIVLSLIVLAVCALPVTAHACNFFTPTTTFSQVQTFSSVPTVVQSFGGPTVVQSVGFPVSRITSTQTFFVDDRAAARAELAAIRAQRQLARLARQQRRAAFFGGGFGGSSLNIRAPFFRFQRFNF